MKKLGQDSDAHSNCLSGKQSNLPLQYGFRSFHKNAADAGALMNWRNFTYIQINTAFLLLILSVSSSFPISEVFLELPKAHPFSPFSYPFLALSSAQ